MRDERGEIVRENASQICGMDEIENAEARPVGPTEDEWLKARRGRMTLRVPAKDCLDCGGYLWVDMGPSEVALKAIIAAYVVKDEGKAVSYDGTEAERWPRPMGSRRGARSAGARTW